MVEYLARKYPSGTPILLVGTKSDTITKAYRPVINNIIQLVKEQLKFDAYILTSSKTGQNIHEVISQITHKMQEFRQKNQINENIVN
jgi:GTPase Era involved in 16S rRNA processing